MTAFRPIGATPFLCPLPVVLLGCADASRPERAGNLITAAWCGVVNTKPPMLSVSIRQSRYSHHLIAESGEFTVNLVNRPITRACDLCGVVSGRDTDKFAAARLTPVPAEGVSAPGVGESPVILSCRVASVTPLGSHDLFLANIVQVSVQERYFRKDGSIDMAAMRLTAYAHGEYFPLADPVGFFGFSVASPRAVRKRAKR